jgi:ribosomal-protein-alanine N-acetyltransferase
MYVARLCYPLEREDGANLAGYIVARAAAGELHINNVAVREEYRGGGVGTALLKRVLDQGRVAGAQMAYLEVRSLNMAAQKLYERSGFFAIGTRKNYYTDPADDALIMGVKLKNDP